MYCCPSKPISENGQVKIHNSFFFFLRFSLFVFRERGRDKERGGEKHRCVFASCAPPTGDLAHNPGMCPDWQPFGLQDGTQSTEPHQLGENLQLLHYFTSSLFHGHLQAIELHKFSSWGLNRIIATHKVRPLTCSYA